VVVAVASDLVDKIRFVHLVLHSQLSFQGTCASAMGCFGSKDKLSKEDMDFLKSHTRYDEATIKEWYKGFKVSTISI
jgi:hypothetical protein